SGKECDFGIRVSRWPTADERLLRSESPPRPNPARHQASPLLTSMNAHLTADMVGDLIGKVVTSRAPERVICALSPPGTPGGGAAQGPSPVRPLADYALGRLP